jgi:hypothetical protein
MFKKYPYLLPCLVSSSFSVFGVIIGFFFLSETRVVHEKSESNGMRASPSTDLLLETEAESTTTLLPEAQSNSNQVFKKERVALPMRKVLTRNVLISIAAYATWAFINVIYDEVLSLFVVTPIASGGLSMSSTELGLVLSSLGIAQIVSQIFIYPVVERSLGLVKTFRLSCILMFIFSALLPFVGDVAKYFYDGRELHSRPLIFVLLFFVLSGRTAAACFGYVSVMICVNDSCPDMRYLGMVHGCGQLASAFVRY